MPDLYRQLPVTIALWNRPLPPTTLSWSWKMSPDISKRPLEGKFTPLRTTLPGQWGSSGSSATRQSSPFPTGRNSCTPLGSTGQIPALSVFLGFFWAREHCKSWWADSDLKNQEISYTHCYACIHAKSLQSCLALCDPMDCSPPGFCVPWIL